LHISCVLKPLFLLTHLVVNHAYRSGQASSLLVGLRALRSSDAALILLGDQPTISIDVICDIVRAWRRNDRPIVRPNLRGNPGHPVIIERPLWGELQVSGDSGARDFMDEHDELILHVMLDRAPFPDIDTRDDLLAISEVPGAAPSRSTDSDEG
jgi:molybdenum cofactor cytidylyltransferase